MEGNGTKVDLEQSHKLTTSLLGICDKCWLEGSLVTGQPNCKEFSKLYRDIRKLRKHIPLEDLSFGVIVGILKGGWPTGWVVFTPNPHF